jgi:hypothetical protein
MIRFDDPSLDGRAGINDARKDAAGTRLSTSTRNTLRESLALWFPYAELANASSDLLLQLARKVHDDQGVGAEELGLPAGYHFDHVDAPKAQTTRSAAWHEGWAEGQAIIARLDEARQALRVERARARAARAAMYARYRTQAVG